MADSVSSASLHTLYKEHHRWLAGWLRRKLGCSEQAADLVHDTFLKVLITQTEIREPRAFLGTVAYGLMVNHLRRRDLERAYLEALAALPEPLAPSAEERIEMLQSLVAVDAVLRGLTPPVRRAFLWWQLEGLSHAEIAQRLGVSISSVRQYIRKAAVHCVLAADL